MGLKGRFFRGGNNRIGFLKFYRMFLVIFRIGKGEKIYRGLGEYECLGFGLYEVGKGVWN